MRQLRIHVIVAAICILFEVSIFANQAFARPIEPLTLDYAEFRNDPYPTGTLQMTIYVHREATCRMTVYLVDPNWNVFRSWQFYNPPIEYQFTQSVSDIDGTWRLECSMPGYSPYVTDAALLHKFNIGDPAPSQNNLGADYARNPQNSAIYQKALQVGNPIDSTYIVAQNIYNHVLTHFHHSEYFDLSFRKDLYLLNDLNTYGEYRGVCRSDAVILTSYARASGIPARIIHLHAVWYPMGGPNPGYTTDEHYFAEFYISIAGVWQWVPVDADPIYNWFGLGQANARISAWWPKYVNMGGRSNGWNIQMSIVTNIPTSGILDDGYSSVSYPSPVPYRNDL